MKKAGDYSAGYLLAALALTTTFFVGNAFAADIVIDNGRAGTSYTGTWSVSGATGYYGANSLWSRDGAKYTWSFTPATSGYYQVSMWWTTYPSRSTSIPVDIRHSGGTARVPINQQANGGKWNVLGTYSLVGGTTYTVTMTSQPGPSSTCADAVKFAYLPNAVAYVAVGDSITRGSRDSVPYPNGGFEPVLAGLLTASKGYPAILTNAGVSGSTSSDGAASISATLSAYPMANYYLVLYGTNDADISGGTAVSKETYKANMQAIVTAITNAGKIPYLAKVPYVDSGNPQFPAGAMLSDDSIQQYNQAVDELRISNGISVVAPDFYSWFKSHTGELADGVHPNHAGYQSMADLWFEVLQ